MEINEILETKSFREMDNELDIFKVDGFISSDSNEDYFRLYPAETDKKHYYLIKKDDIAGEIYEWTTEEKSKQLFIDQPRFRIPLKIGTEIIEVKMSTMKVGVKGEDASAKACCKTSCSGTKPDGSSWTSSCGTCGCKTCIPSSCSENSCSAGCAS
ncbi:hypothetical protein [Winogradskyella sp.]|uniref:hypothetical protein n=1 Tax=Winogradskyella sp. TaxID=1883156 RepID=UPI0026099E27|nr:hypothetical protein [Winogradskyella sp.]